MKKQLMHVVPTLTNKFFKASAFALALTLAVPAAYAGENPDPRAGKNTISHVATTTDNLLFEVRVPNEKGEKFTLLIRDNNGVTLYRGVYTEKGFAKKFQFPKGDADKLTFVIKGASENTSESFEINSNTRTVEEVIVKRIS